MTKPGEALPLPMKPGDKPPEAVAPTRTRLIVDAPADAKLYIDDTAMRTQSEHRSYQTPDLEPGQTYYYEVRGKAQRDGKPVSETRRAGAGRAGGPRRLHGHCHDFDRPGEVTRTDRDGTSRRARDSRNPSPAVACASHSPKKSHLLC